MRKLIGLAVIAAAALATASSALAGQAATNANGDFIDLNVAVSPPIASPANVHRGASVSFDSFTGNRINGNAPDTSTSIVVRFNKGFKFNGARFPSCTINPAAPTSTCPASSRIGTGTAEASIPGANGAPPSFVPATLAAYNGKPFSGSARTVIFIASLNGRPAAEIDFSVAEQPTGPYGLAFTQIQFPGAGPPAFGITKFSVAVPDQTVTRRVRGKRTKVHLIQAPRTCRRSWKFAQTDTFSNAPALTATDTQPCVKR